MSTTPRRQQRVSRRPSHGLLSMLVSCVGVYAALLGALPPVAGGTLGQGLLATALGVGGLHILLAPRRGVSPHRALLEVLAVSVITLAIVYSCAWYYTVYLASRPGLIQLDLKGPIHRP